MYLANASWWAGRAVADYDPLRPPLLSVVQAPIVAAARKAGPGSVWLLVGPHLASAALTALAEAAVFLVLRAPLGPLLALLGAVLLAGTRHVVHYGAHVMTDVPLAGLCATTIGLFVRARERRRLAGYTLAGVALGASVAMKYSGALLLPALVMAEGLLSLGTATGAGERRLRLRLDLGRCAGLALCVGVGVVAFAALHAWLYLRLYPREPWTGFVATMTSGQAMVTAFGGESWTDHVAMATVMLSMPLCALACLGIGIAVLRPERRDAPFLAWLVTVGGGIVFLVGHNEARYLLPAVPAVIFFALRAVERGCAALGSAPSGPRSASHLALALGLAGLVGLSLSGGVRQAWEDRDPVFADDLQRRAALTLAALRRGEGRLFVLGTRHTLFPLSPGPVPQDEYWNTFHYDPAIPAYFLGTRLNTLSTRTSSAWDLRESLGLVAIDGDAVLRLDDRFYTTATRPAGRPDPFEVWSIRRVDLTRAGTNDRFASTDGSVAGTLRESAAGTVFVPEQTLGEHWMYAAPVSTSRNQFIAPARLEAGVPIALPRMRIGEVAALTLIRVDVRPVASGPGPHAARPSHRITASVAPRLAAPARPA